MIKPGQSDDATFLFFNKTYQHKKHHCFEKPNPLFRQGAGVD